MRVIVLSVVISIGALAAPAAALPPTPTPPSSCVAGAGPGRVSAFSSSNTRCQLRSVGDSVVFVALTDAAYRISSSRDGKHWRTLYWIPISSNPRVTRTRVGKGAFVRVQLYCARSSMTQRCGTPQQDRASGGVYMASDPDPSKTEQYAYASAMAAAQAAADLVLPVVSPVIDPINKILEPGARAIIWDAFCAKAPGDAGGYCP